MLQPDTLNTLRRRRKGRFEILSKGGMVLAKGGKILRDIRPRMSVESCEDMRWRTMDGDQGVQWTDEIESGILSSSSR